MMIELKDSSGAAFRIAVLDTPEYHMSFSYDNAKTIMVYRGDGLVFGPPRPYNQYGAFFYPHGETGPHTPHPLGS
jgi:hypothetical protein